MHGGRGVCQWCARSSPVETRQNPRPRTTTTATTINSNNSNNNDIDNVGGRSIRTDIGSGEGSYKNLVSNNDNNIKNIRSIGDNSSRRGTGARRRRRRCCCRVVSSRPVPSNSGVVSARRGVAPFFMRRRC
jgi:hypothetical protein